MTKSRFTDAQLKDAVTHELVWDDLVDVADVGVEVQQGVVTLSGIVDSWAKRVAALNAAHRVRGVRDVADELVVRTLGANDLTDAQVAQHVRHALVWDVFAPNENIHSTVNHGWVVLEGKVETLSERDAAARAIQNLAGVRGVTNKLDVVPPPAAPSQLRAAIEAALDRRAAREAARLTLDVEDSTVTVSGEVESWADKEAVLGAIKGTRGVKAVDDRLQVFIRVP